MASDKVKVAVRVRPFNRREIELGTKRIVEMRENQTSIYRTVEGKDPKVFAYDYSFWSFQETDDNYSGQEDVFKCLGLGILDNAFDGYNACMFAYGQTGSGKSFTMMGGGDNKGIMPRLCSELFGRIHTAETANLSFKVEVSYMEIYNEKVRDLLDPHGIKHNLKVREHSLLGPYVDGLSALAVSSFEQIETLMEEGNKSRTVAATNMNSESSRSHAVFEIKLSQTLVDVESGVAGEKVSKISLVDLAGSERAQKTGVIGDRLKEGSNINRSLTTLGLVISALADQSIANASSLSTTTTTTSSAKSASKPKFVPYRDSVLTWLLKDCLGGNSRTVMLATVSPAADNYEESLSTLRYADRAKRIVNCAVVNEDPNARLIRELRSEVENLRKQLMQHSASFSASSSGLSSLSFDLQSGDTLQDRLAESEKLVAQLTQSWEEKLQQTETVHQERVQQLEKMGISVQASGIKVDQGKFYLVNLNPDPSLNELLVYYLKDTTLVGRADSHVVQDIQLSGLGIQPQHAILEIEAGDLFVVPLCNAKTCVNGTMISQRTQLKHTDRIVWGNNHFFRVNCPGEAVAQQTNGHVIDYEYAKEELLQKEFGDHPLTRAVADLEKQHEQDKQAALAKQRKMYETQLQLLRLQMWSPSTPSFPDNNNMPSPFPRSDVQKKYVQWAHDRDDAFKLSIAKLKEDIVRANGLIREANIMALEMARQTTFHVSLQIPAANLTPSKIRTGAFVSEPAILVKRKGRGSQVWSMEKLENKLIDMRELYEDWKFKGSDGVIDWALRDADPFFEAREDHNLIGVANIFLEVLFHDVKLDYHVPIINQQGEVAGRLRVEIYRVDNASATGSSELSSSDIADDDVTCASMEKHLFFGSQPVQNDAQKFHDSQITCRVRIVEASNLPTHLSNYVFCQYSFWNCQESVVVAVANDSLASSSTSSFADQSYISPSSQSVRQRFIFDHERDFTVTVTDEFREHVQDGALSIEVWGHRSAGFGSASNKPNSWDVKNLNAAKSRSLQDRWAEVTRRLELWVEVHELNESGEYAPVEVLKSPEVPSGGVYQLRQVLKITPLHVKNHMHINLSIKSEPTCAAFYNFKGQQRRIVAKINLSPESGLLPLVCTQITSMLFGAIVTRSRLLQKGLDSYQEEDLGILRDRWQEALSHRRKYLDEHIQRLMRKINKSEEEVEREQALIAQWVALTEERNAVLVPAPNSGVPGSPADWSPPPGMERHIPVLFLDLSTEEMNQSESLQQDRSHIPGMNSLLPKEYGGKMFPLQIRRFDEHDLTAEAFWDSSMHDQPALNRPTGENERIYGILQVILRLSHPAVMDIVLRKRLCFNIVKRVSLTQKLLKKITRSDNLACCGVTYEVVSNVPKATEDPESRETLALFAATATGESGDSGYLDGESYIEKYLKGVSEVESILVLDRLRQEVAIKELLAAQNRMKPKKSTSLPTFSSSHIHSSSVGDVLPSTTSSELNKGQQRLALNRGTSADTSRILSCDNKSLLARPTFLKLKPFYSGNITSLVSPVTAVAGARLTPPRRSMKPVAEELTPKHRVSSPYPDKPIADLTIATTTTAEETVAKAKDSEQVLLSVTALLENGHLESEEEHNCDTTTIKNLFGKVGDINTGVVENAGSFLEETTIDSELLVQTANTESHGNNYCISSPETVLPEEECSLQNNNREVSPGVRQENGSINLSSVSEPLTDVNTHPTLSSPKESTTVLPATLVNGHYNNEYETQNIEVVTGPVLTQEINNDCVMTVSVRSNKASLMETSTYSDLGAHLECNNSGTDSAMVDSGAYVLSNSMIDSFISEDSAEGAATLPNNVLQFGNNTDSTLGESINSISQPKYQTGFEIGADVIVQPGNKAGVVRFIGETKFAGGMWIGVDLQLAQGKHNGTVDNVCYFSCAARHGIFVRAERVRLVTTEDNDIMSLSTSSSKSSLTGATDDRNMNRTLSLCQPKTQQKKGSMKRNSLIIETRVKK